jgi:hypothetical protein
VWNLAVEQLSYRAHSQRVPGYVEQSKKLTEARAAFGWLAAGSQTVQQQALRDFDQAVANWRGGTHRRPGWRNGGWSLFATRIAARNIAARRAVTARGATGVPVTVNREPQHVTPPPVA